MERPMSTPTICLVMVVKNEEDFILPALQSVAPYIDTYLILDSHSTDKTIKQVKDFFAGTALLPCIPGTVHQYDGPLRGDAKRTEAMHLARGRADYLLMIDADNTLQIEQDQKSNPFADIGTYDCYNILKVMGNTRYMFPQLFRGSMDWKFTGIIHEFPELADEVTAYTTGTLQGAYVTEPEKHLVDKIEPHHPPRTRTRLHYYDHALLIERELLENPGLRELLRVRYTFYLANSWKDAGCPGRAIECYTHRVSMGGFQEEVFYSLLMIAYLKEATEAPAHEIFLAAMAAWNYRTQRREGTYMVMRMLHKMQFYTAAWHIGLISRDLPCNDVLLVDRNVCDKLYPDLMQQLQDILIPT